MEGFAEVSPDVGILNEEALAEQMEENPDDALGMLAELTGATDPELRRMARRLAARLFLDLANHERPDGKGVGRLITTRYVDGMGDLDVDASMAAIVEARASGELVDPEDLRIRSWARPSVAWCLLVDRSGSMHGQPLATAGLAAAAVAARQPKEYAVLSFGRTVIAPKAMWETRSADSVIERTLSLRGHGTTDVAAALRAAAWQLRHASAQRRVAVILSDCRATEPGDIAAAARMLDELVVIAPEGDDAAAIDLAEMANARWTTFSGPSSLIAAFDRVVGR